MFHPIAAEGKKPAKAAGIMLGKQARKQLIFFMPQRKKLRAGLVFLNGLKLVGKPFLPAFLLKGVKHFMYDFCRKDIRIKLFRQFPNCNLFPTKVD